MSRKRTAAPRPFSLCLPRIVVSPGREYCAHFDAFLISTFPHKRTPSTPQLPHLVQNPIRHRSPCSSAATPPRRFWSKNSQHSLRIEPDPIHRHIVHHHSIDALAIKLRSPIRQRVLGLCRKSNHNRSPTRCATTSRRISSVASSSSTTPRAASRLIFCAATLLHPKITHRCRHHHDRCLAQPLPSSPPASPPQSRPEQSPPHPAPAGSSER